MVARNGLVHDVEIRWTGRPPKNGCECANNDMESVGLSRNDAQSTNKNCGPMFTLNRNHVC